MPPKKKASKAKKAARKKKAVKRPTKKKASKRTPRAARKKAKAPKKKTPKKATRASLARWVAQHTELSAHRAYGVLDAVLEGIGAALAAGGTVELRGFGTFWVNARGARTIQVPEVGAVKVPAKQDVKFRPGEPLETTVRQGLRKSKPKQKPARRR